MKALHRYWISTGKIPTILYDRNGYDRNCFHTMNRLVNVNWRDEKHLSFRIRCGLHWRFDGNPGWMQYCVNVIYKWTLNISQTVFFLYKTLFLRNYIRLHTTSSYQIDGPAETETIPLLMHWNRLSPIPKSSRWYQYIYMQTATYNKHPQTCFYKHNRYVNHIKITVHSIM